MPLTAGSRVGSYEVLAPIGAGGMGEVYRARDTRLNRDVALKVLPDVFSGDADRRARFEREAQLLAALNHPHIAQIYGLEDSAAGIHALVMELVDGPTLADRIAQGPIPVDEALAIARQIAEALEAAHDRGVIHRDLKPANVKMTADGAVKVLDFGLAKLIEPAATSGSAGATAQSPLTLSPTLSVQATYAGVLLGTAAYMSPEQARGRTVDHRADVWAFGCVVYEMLTALRPFAGDDLAETIGAVIHKQVDWSRLPADTPAAVRVTLERCLEKDPKRRLRDIGDVRLALSGAFATPAASVAPVRAPARRLVSVAVAAGALTLGVIAAGAAVWVLARPVPAPVQISRFTVTPTAGQGVGETNTDRQLTISPDGRRIVWVTGGGGLGGALVMRQVDRLNAELMAGITLARNPFFSPDSQSIGFFTGPNGELRRVSINGGPTSAVSRVVGTARGASWGDDGTIVFATNDPSTGLLAVPSGGGEPKVLTKPDGTKGEVDHFYPSVLPGGEAVIFTILGGSRDSARLAVLDLKTGRYKDLVPGGSDAVYVETGHLLYASAGALRAVRFDLRSLELSGDSVPVLDQIAVLNTGAAQYAVARNGTLAYLGGTIATSGVRRSLVWVDRRGREEPLTAEQRAYTYPRLSPDGARLAVNILDEGLDIWVWEMRRPGWQRVTLDPVIDFSPFWTIDGNALIFASPRGGVPNLYRRRADGTGRDERMTTSTNVQWPTGGTPDGKMLIVHEEVKGNVDLTHLSVDSATNGKGQTTPLIQSAMFNEDGGDISPDGRFIAYYSNRSGTSEVYVQPYPEVDRLWQVSIAGGTRPTWSKDGGELFYLDLNTAMMAVPVETKPTFSAGLPTKLFDGPWYVGQSRTYDVSKDSRRFLMLKQAAATAEAPLIGVNVVLNWTEELKQRLPR